MNSKERVLTALHYEEPDRVPIFYLGFTPQWVERLIGRRPKDFVKDYLPIFYRFSSDIIVVSPDVFYPFDVYARGEWVDEWGRKLRVVGYYCEFVDFPIKKPEDIDSYTPPDPDKPERVKDIIKVKKVVREEKAIMSVVNGPFEMAYLLRGLDTFLKDLRMNPKLAEKCLDIATEFEIQMGIRVIEAGADIVMIGDDYGWQKSLLMHPELWRKFILPRLKKVVQEFKKRNVSVILHSDGNITALLDDLAAIGLDGLNPIQIRCGVSPEYIKKRYPKLAMVGLIDEQYLLPFGSREEIMNEIKRIILAVAPGGGLILGPQHNVQPDIPVKNIEIMVDAIKKYGRYPIKDIDTDSSRQEASIKRKI